ncbi:hypothetical protein L7F22_016464 [Adiantum nelumboides]|nr:hypothetical protein [Adiantum nelumboides]
MPSTRPERHIAIVGGGIIGAASLYYLAQHSTASASAPLLRLTLIEEAKQVAPGASGKSGGFLAEDWHGADTADLAKLSYRLHRELAEREDGRARWGYRAVETVSLAFDDSKRRAKCPPELDWLAAEHVSSASSMGGSGTTAQVTPLALVQHLVAAASKESNVEVRLATRAQHVTVNDAGHINGLVVRDSTGEQTLAVDDVVVAAGPWTGKLLTSLLPPGLAVPSFYRNASRITGSRAHSIVVQSPKPTSAHCLFTDMHYGRQAGAPEVYCREDGTIYACGGSDDVPLPASADEVTHDGEQTRTLIAQMEHLSPSHLSAAAGAKVTKQQACYLPVAPRGPTIAGDDRLGLYVAAGHSCWASRSAWERARWCRKWCWARCRVQTLALYGDGIAQVGCVFKSPRARPAHCQTCLNPARSQTQTDTAGPA